MSRYVGATYTVRGFTGPRGVLLEGNIFTWDARGLELIREEEEKMNKIILDGKEYELSAELVEKIKAEVALQEMARQVSENPFERMRSDDYHFITAEGCVFTGCETGTIADDERYSAANYCRDKGMMEQRALHETLNRLLWRYSEEHGGDNAWNSQNPQDHCYIYLHTQNSALCVSYNDAHCVEGVVYFKDKATAEAAIEEVVKPFMAAHPEFVW